RGHPLPGVVRAWLLATVWSAPSVRLPWKSGGALLLGGRRRTTIWAGPLLLAGVRLAVAARHTGLCAGRPRILAVDRRLAGRPDVVAARGGRRAAGTRWYPMQPALTRSLHIGGIRHVARIADWSAIGSCAVCACAVCASRRAAV